MIEFVLNNERINQQEWNRQEAQIQGLPLEIQNQFRRKLAFEQGQRGLTWLKCQRIIAEMFSPVLINGHINDKFN
jgi:hypothetical protein